MQTRDRRQYPSSGLAHSVLPTLRRKDKTPDDQARYNLGREIKQITEEMNGRNTAKGQRLLGLRATRQWSIGRHSLSALASGREVQHRESLSPPQGHCKKCCINTKAHYVPVLWSRCAFPAWPSRPGCLLKLVLIHHNNKLQGTGFLVQVYLLCVLYLSALNLGIKSSIRV